MTIAATRMYRGLDDFLSTDTYENHAFLSSLGSLRENTHVAHTYQLITLAVVAKIQSEVPRPCQIRSMG
jgi:hypothetical protein